MDEYGRFVVFVWDYVTYVCYMEEFKADAFLHALWLDTRDVKNDVYLFPIDVCPLGDEL